MSIDVYMLTIINYITRELEDSYTAFTFDRAHEAYFAFKYVLCNKKENYLKNENHLSNDRVPSKDPRVVLKYEMKNDDGKILYLAYITKGILCDDTFE